MRFQATLLAAALGAALAFGGDARAVTLALSHDSGASPPTTLGGVTFPNGTVVVYDTVGDSSTILFDESSFAGSENVNAFDLLPNGNMYLSTTNTASLGGTNYSAGDVIGWDPVNLVSSLIFSGSLFAQGENVDAVAALPNGNILLSTATDATLGGTSFRDGDVVEWDLVNGVFVGVYFSEDLFGGLDVNVDAFDVNGAGMILVSTFENNVTLGGLTFDNGDVALYDPFTDSASLYFDESAFGSPEDIDAAAFAVPEPGTASLLGLGLVGLAAAGRRRRSA